MLKHYQRTVLVFSQLLLALFASSDSYAIPAFSRQYGTSCSTCHVDFPKLTILARPSRMPDSSFPRMTRLSSRFRR